jgi:hypothetical protein
VCPRRSMASFYVFTPAHDAESRKGITGKSNNRNQILLYLCFPDEMTISPSSLICILLCIAATVQSVSILEGDFETTTDVQAYLNLALHAAAMKEAEDMTTKKRIYSQVGGGKYVSTCGTELIPKLYIISSSFVFRVSIRRRLHYSH